MGNKVNIKLTPRQVKLLVEYSYPFEFEADQLKAMLGKSEVQVLESCDFYAPRLIGDLVYSAKKIKSTQLIEELEELAYCIESSMQ